MSDQHDAGSLPELTPEQESAVRQLLAEARHDVPIPSDVADRLDTVLAGLSRDEPGAPGVAPVIDLAARRRRRNAAGVLAGAAAVIVAGFVGAQVIDVSSDDAGSNELGCRRGPREYGGRQGRIRRRRLTRGAATRRPRRRPPASPLSSSARSTWRATSRTSS